VPEIRNSLKSSLQEAADCEIGSKERHHWLKIALAAKYWKLNLLYGYLWRLKVLEPTNNAAESLYVRGYMATYQFCSNPGG